MKQHKQIMNLYELSLAVRALAIESGISPYNPYDHSNSQLSQSTTLIANQFFNMIHERDPRAIQQCQALCLELLKKSNNPFKSNSQELQLLGFLYSENITVRSSSQTFSFRDMVRDTCKTGCFPFVSHSALVLQKHPSLEFLVSKIKQVQTNPTNPYEFSRKLYNAIHANKIRLSHLPNDWLLGSRLSPRSSFALKHMITHGRNNHSLGFTHYFFHAFKFLIQDAKADMWNGNKEHQTAARKLLHECCNERLSFDVNGSLTPLNMILKQIEKAADLSKANTEMQISDPFSYKP